MSESPNHCKCGNCRHWKLKALVPWFGGKRSVETPLINGPSFAGPKSALLEEAE